MVAAPSFIGPGASRRSVRNGRCQAEARWCRECCRMFPDTAIRRLHPEAMEAGKGEAGAPLRRKRAGPELSPARALPVADDMQVSVSA